MSIDGSMMIKTYRHDIYFWKVFDGNPFTLQVFQVAQEDDSFQLIVVEVAGPERHDEAAQTYQWRVCLTE